MNDSENNMSKVIIGIIIAVLVIIVAVYAYNLLKDDTNINDMKNDVNQVGRDVSNGTQNLVNGTGEMIEDVADGVSNAVDSVIDFTMTDNATIENNTKTNTSEKIRADKKYQELTFKEVTLIGRNNVTTFTAKIKNNATTYFKSKDVTITFFKKDSRKEGGKYITLTARLKKIDATAHTIVLTDGVTIPIADLYALSTAAYGESYDRV